ncbi:MAG: response regulator [Pseudobacteriovorax sp.]|nr:response regulator [Pseudobacteriovorax sp.]
MTWQANNLMGRVPIITLSFGIQADGILSPIDIYQTQLGYEINELKQRTFESIVHPESQASLLTKINEIKSGNTQDFSMQADLIHGYGHRLACVLQGQINQDPDGTEVEILISIPEDSLLHVEKDPPIMTHQSSRLTAIEGLIDWRIGEDTCFLSPNLWAMFGISASTKRHHPEEFSRLIGSKSYKDLLDEIHSNQAFRQGRQFTMTFSGDHSNGSRVWIRCLLRIAEIDEKGRVSRVFGSINDCTTEKQLEAELHDVKDLVRRKTIAKAQFLANMSHAIRTPLNSIIGYLDLMDSGKLSEEQISYINTVKQSSTSLHSVLNDILDYSQIETGDFTIKPVECNLYSVLVAQLNQAQSRALKTAVTLTYDIDCLKGLTLLIDEHRLCQIIKNLINNGIRYTEANGTVAVEAALKHRNDQDLLSFSISDNGIGMSTKELKKIFDPFQQTVHSEFNRQGISGLSLPLSDKILKLMNSKLICESSPGNGTKFTFDLPWNIKHIAKRDENIESLGVSLKDLHVLIVEDNEVNLHLAMRIVQKLGMKATGVNCGAACLRAIETTNFDVILMDCHMPEMDGFTTVEEIKLRFPDCNAKIIALTADAMPGIKEHCLNVGMDDYLNKPFNKNSLMESISKNVR